MPIYEFKCPECGHKRETIAPVCNDQDYPKSQCPVCGKYMKRLMSRPAIIKVN